MSPDRLARAAPGRSVDLPDIIHTVCTFCSPDIALCGEDMSGDEYVDAAQDNDDDECVVCLDLEPLPCGRCGQ